MENVTLADAKEHLEDMIERASRGGDVRIVDAKIGSVFLTPIKIGKQPHASHAASACVGLIKAIEPASAWS
jgi:antitoxin (DNA-binding transcriptional repressor) of toxin-antitoxin stability system